MPGPTSAPSARARIVLAALVLLIGTMAAACGTPGSGEGSAGSPAATARTGDALTPDDRVAAPEITGQLLDGGDFTLADLDDHVVVLNFWGSWCGPCRAEAPELQAAHVATQPLGVAFVGVNVRDQKPLAEAFVRTKGLTYPNLFDPAGAVALRLDATPPSATPATVVLDRRHRVAAVWPGPVAGDALEAVVRAVAAEPVG